MSTVLTHMTMSLDGFIADPTDGIDELFGWYGAGEVTLPTKVDQFEFNVDEASAELLRGYLDSSGALVCGRRLFDITNGWDDQHPMGAPVVVVTHHAPDDADTWPRTTFVDDVATGIAKAKEIAGDKNVVIASADVSAQALDLGLVDEVHVSLVPVLMGEGIPYFANLGSAPHRFDDPVVIPGKRATHLQYTVRRD
jgi:dihydrofolate reductase